MKLLFITDPLESFKIYKDTTFAMMREAQRRGHTLAVCLPQDLVWQRGSQVTARVRDIIVLTGDSTNWFQAQPLRSAALTAFDAMLRAPDRDRFVKAIASLTGEMWHTSLIAARASA